MTQATPIVFVVDDDPSVREALSSLIRSVGLSVKTFSSAQEFLTSQRPDAPACLVLDVRLPGLSGLDLQRELAATHSSIPIIFITGHGDVPTSVRAMKGGAVDFLQKPFNGQDLLDCIHHAISMARQRVAERAERAAVQSRFATLTPREREVLALVVTGRLNKQIADDLGAAEKTVKVHRGRVMEKMQARSVADLVRMAQKLEP
jgi:FixJ family two-component response regulator